MKNIKFLILPLITISSLCLSGCISREQSDAKLEKGCLAAVGVFMKEGFEIQKINDRSFSDNAHLGHGYRNVRLNVTETDGWYENEKEYSCIFLEEVGPFGVNHSVSFYQLKMNGQTYGQDGNKIIGSLEDHRDLTNAVENAMR